MSERPTDPPLSRGAAVHPSGHEAHARSSAAGRQASAGGRTLADRAADFRQGAPFLVERATLYDPEPLESSVIITHVVDRLPRRLLPAALTLLGVVVVVGLSAAVLVMRNADVVRRDQGEGRLELFSDRALPRATPGGGPGAQPNSTTVAYDLSRRPSDAIVGAWRKGADGDGGRAEGESASDATKRRPLPYRSSPTLPEVPPEAVTRPVAAIPPRYDAPEPKRRAADGEVGYSQGQSTVLTGEAAARNQPGSPGPTGVGDAERTAPSVVARVGRASEPIEGHAHEPVIEIPLELALPLRRPDPDKLEEQRKTGSLPPRARRARLFHLQRQMRREQQRAKRNDPSEITRTREATFGDWYVGTQRQRP